jgi:hypothetical protein
MAQQNYIDPEGYGCVARKSIVSDHHLTCPRDLKSDA